MSSNRCPHCGSVLSKVKDARRDVVCMLLPTVFAATACVGFGLNYWLTIAACILATGLGVIVAAIADATVAEAESARRISCHRLGDKE